MKKIYSINSIRSIPVSRDAQSSYIYDTYLKTHTDTYVGNTVFFDAKKEIYWRIAHINEPSGYFKTIFNMVKPIC